MWPFLSCLAAKASVQPHASCLVTTAGTALVLINTARLRSHLFAGYGCRDPFPSPLLSACHPSASSPPVAPLPYHFKHMLHTLAITVHLHPPSASSVTQLGKGASHLQLAPGASLPSPTASIFKRVIFVFIPYCSSCSL